MKAQSIKIDNVCKREEAERKIEALKKITKESYCNFEFTVCPAGGSLDIYLSSDYEFDTDEYENTSPEIQMLRTFIFNLLCKI